MPHLDWPTTSKVKTGGSAKNSQESPSKIRNTNHNPLRCCHATTCKKPRVRCKCTRVEPLLVWIRMCAIFVMNAIITIPDATFGLCYDPLIELYGATRAEVGWTFSVLITTGMLTGMFASPFMDLYGCRPVSIFGAILYTTGMVLAPFSPNLICLYLSYGLIAGVGWGISLVSGMTVIQNIFTYNRGLATGLVAFGFTLGTVVSPLIMESLLEAYGIRGALLMHGGIVAHTLVFSTALKTKRKPPEVSLESRSSLSLHDEVELEQADSAPPWVYVEYHNGLSPSIEPWSYEAWPITTCIEDAEGALRPVTGSSTTSVVSDYQLTNPEAIDAESKEEQQPSEKSSNDPKNITSDLGDDLDCPRANEGDGSDELSREKASTSQLTDAGDPSGISASETGHRSHSEVKLSSITEHPDFGSDRSVAALHVVDGDLNKSMGSDNHENERKGSIQENDDANMHKPNGSDISIGAEEAEYSKETLEDNNDTANGDTVNNVNDTGNVQAKEEISSQDPPRDLDSATEENQDNTGIMVEEDTQPTEDANTRDIVDDRDSEADDEPVEISEEKQILLNPENLCAETDDVEHKQNTMENQSRTGSEPKTHSDTSLVDNLQSEISLQACEDDVTNGVVEMQDQVDSSKSSKQKFVNELFKNFRDFSLFKDPVFVVYIICNFMTLVGRMCIITHFPSAAYHRGATTWEVATFLSVIGLSNFAFRAASTLLLNLRRMNYIAYYTVGLLFLSASEILAIGATTYNTMVICMVLLGACEGISNTVFPLVITSIAGVDRFAKALGLLNAAVLWTPFVAAPLSGWLVDITGDYVMTFVLGSTCSVISTLFGIIVVIVQEVRKRRKREPEVGDSVDIHMSIPNVDEDTQHV